MTITLPEELETRLKAAVDDGRFASVDDAMAEAARLLLRELDPDKQVAPPTSPDDLGPDLFLGSIGAMRDAADELDEIVIDAYRRRRSDTWRDLDLE